MLRARDKPQQLSEAKEYLLRAVEKPQQLKKLFAAASSKTAAINSPTENLLRAHVKPQHIIDFFFLNSFCYLMLHLMKIAANKVFSTSGGLLVKS